MPIAAFHRPADPLWNIIVGTRYIAWQSSPIAAFHRSDMEYRRTDAIYRVRTMDSSIHIGLLCRAKYAAELSPHALRFFPAVRMTMIALYGIVILNEVKHFDVAW
jgi:hypothetical protein